MKGWKTGLKKSISGYPYSKVHSENLTKAVQVH